MSHTEKKILVKLKHSADSEVEPIPIRTGSRPNHRFSSFPEEYFMGVFELIDLSELKSGEFCDAYVHVLYHNLIEKEFYIGNVWEVTSASKHIGYCEIIDIT